MSFAQTSIYLRLPLYSGRVILSECVRLYVLLILFASISELYAANTTINAVPVPKTERKGEMAKENI